jgi:hypothetical protein
MTRKLHGLLLCFANLAILPGCHHFMSKNSVPNDDTQLRQELVAQKAEAARQEAQKNRTQSPIEQPEPSKENPSIPPLPELIVVPKGPKSAASKPADVSRAGYDTAPDGLLLIQPPPGVEPKGQLSPCVGLSASA